MSNTWKQYGGIRKQDKFHNLNIGVLVADQVLLRESYAGKFKIPGSIYVGADVYTIGNNYTYQNTYTSFDNFVGKNLYVKKLLYFGTDMSINDNNAYDYAYMYGDFAGKKIGVNTNTPSHSFDVKGMGSQTDVLSVSSNTSQVRSVLGKNVTNDGITLNVTNANATLGFYLDTSLNYANTPNAQINYSAGGNMYYNSTNNNIVSSANTLLTAGGSTSINTQTLINISAGQSLTINTKNTNILSKLAISNRTQAANIYDVSFNESTIIYDISNGLYLYDAYENNDAKAGSAVTMVATDNSSNTFLRLVTPNKAGLSIAAGTYPNDQTRAINAYGITDNTGKYRVNQTVVTGNSATKYYATTGFNTYAPRTENYVMDINGPTHISNGEINKMAEFDFEILQTSFSKINKQFGITVGTPSTTYTVSTSRFYPQYISYTSDGGINWTLVRVDGISNFENFSRNLKIFAYDSNYSILVANSSIYYTLNGGKNWTLTDLKDPVGADLTRNIIALYIGENNVGSDVNIKRVFLVYTLASSPLQMRIEYFNFDFTRISTYVDNFNRIITFTTLSPLININTINTIDGFGNTIYFVGTGINKYQISTVTSQYLINADKTYYAIQCFDATYAVAVGLNIISYTYDGTNWTNIVLSSIPTIGNVTLRSVYLLDINSGMAVGDNGVFLYTNNRAQTWTVVPNSILNSSGYASRINGSYNNLRHIFMNDSNTMSIAAVKNRYTINTTGNTIVSVTPGLSKIYTCYIPNLYNRATNKIFDVSGNMEISGDININDGGNLITNNTTFNLINNNATTVNFAGDANTIIIGKSNINGKTHLRHNFDVSGNITIEKNIFAYGDLSLNGKSNIDGNLTVGGNLLYVKNNAKFDGDIEVKGNILYDQNFKFINNLYAENDTYLYQRVFVGGDASLNGNVYIGGPLYISTTITPNSNTITLNKTQENTEFPFEQYAIESSQSLEIGTSVSYANLIPSGTKIAGISKIDSITGRELEYDNIAQKYVDKITRGDLIGSVINGPIITLDRIISSVPGSFTTPITNAKVSYENSKIFSVYQDTSLNSRLYVGGDTSLNGRLSVSKDISLNGNLIMYNSTSYMNLTPNVITYYNNTKNPPFYEDLPLTQLQYIKTLTQSVQEILNTVTSKTGPIGISYNQSIPTNLTLINRTTNSITISFTLPPGQNPAAVYKAYINGLFTNSTAGGPSSFTITGLTQQTSYSITVSSIVGTVETAQSLPLIIATRDFSLGLLDINNDASSYALESTDIDPTTQYVTDELIIFTQNNISSQDDTNFTSNNNATRDVPILTFDITDNNVLVAGNLIPTTFGDINFGTASFPYASMYLYNENAINFIGNQNGNVTQGGLTFNTNTGELDLSYNGKLGSTVLSYNGNVAIGKATPTTTLDVLGTTLFNGNITQQTGNLYLNNRLFVESDISLGGNLFSNRNLFQRGDSTLNARLIVQGDVSVNSNLFVLRDVSMDNRIYVGGDASLNANLFVGRQVNIVGDLSLNNRLSVRSDVSLNAGLFVANRTFLNGDLSLNGNANISGNVIVDGNVNMKRDLSLNGNVNINGFAFLNSDEYLKGNLFVTGNQFLNGTIIVNGTSTQTSDVFMSSRLFVSRDVSLNGKLYVANQAILNNDVQMNGNVHISNDLSLNGNLSVGGDRLILNGDASMNGNLSLHKTLFAMGDVSFNGNLYVNARTINNSDVIVGNRLFIGNDASFNSNVFVNSRFTVISDSSLNGNLTVGKVLTSSGDLLATNRLFVNRDVSLNGNLYVNQFTILNNDISVNGNLSVSNAVVRSNIFINGNTILFSDASFNANLIVGGSTVIKGNLTSGNLTSTNMINNGSLINTGDITSNGNLNISSNLLVNQNTNLNGNLRVGGSANINGTLVLANDISINGRLNVARYVAGSIPIGAIAGGAGLGLGSFANDVNIGKNFYVGGDTTLYGNLTVVQDFLLIGNLSVKQYSVNQTITTLEYQLLIAEDLSVNGRVFLMDDVSMNKRLFVDGDVSMGSNLFVEADASFSQNVTIGNALIISGNVVQNGRVTTNALSVFNADVSLNNRLSVLGGSNFINDVSMNTRLYVARDVSMGSNLFVNSRTILNGDVSMNTRLYVQNDASMGSNLFVNSRTTLNGNVSMNSHLFVQNDSSFNANLFVNSNTILNGDVSMNTLLYVGRDGSFNANLFVNTRTILNGDVSMNTRLYVARDSSFNANLFVNSNAILNGDVSMNTRLYVARDVSMGSNLFVNSNTILNGDVSMNTRLYVARDVSINGNFYVGGKTIFNNDVSFNKFLYATDASYSGNVAIYGNLYLNQDLRFDNLFVKDILNATGNVYITGRSTQMIDASLSGNLNVNLDTSLNGRLAVAQDVSLVSSLDLNGPMIARNNMNVYGIINQYTSVATPQNTIVNNTSYVTSNASQVTLGTSSNQSVYVPGNVGIGTTSPSVPLFVNKSVSSTGQADGYYFDNTGSTIKPNSTTSPYNYSIYAINSIGTSDKIVASSAIYFSDERIKTNIENIDIEMALDSIRKLEPKKYEYIDIIGKGSEPTWGFVAQQVKNVLEYTVSTSNNFIPDIYELCEIVDEKTIRLINKTTDNFVLASSLKAMSKNHCELFFTIKEILDDKTFTVEQSIHSDDIFENKIFIYGKEIDDFNNLDKNAIFTITTAALKQVDKELQDTKKIVNNQSKRIHLLEEQMKIINDKFRIF
jgi:predicted acyltransferase (DUF342 family)